MTTITSAKQAVRMIPAIWDSKTPSLSYIGVSQGNQDADHVLITSAAIKAAGGMPYRTGQTWSVILDLGYITSAGAWTALFATNPASAVFTVYDPITAETISTRTMGTLIIAGVYQIYASFSGAFERMLITWHDSETAPAAGNYAWSFVADFATYEYRARGWLEIEPAGF